MIIIMQVLCKMQYNINIMSSQQFLNRIIEKIKLKLHRIRKKGNTFSNKQKNLFQNNQFYSYKICEIKTILDFKNK